MRTEVGAGTQRDLRRDQTGRTGELVYVFSLPWGSWQAVGAGVLSALASWWQAGQSWPGLTGHGVEPL